MTQISLWLLHQFEPYAAENAMFKRNGRTNYIFSDQRFKYTILASTRRFHFSADYIYNRCQKSFWTPTQAENSPKRTKMGKNTPNGAKLKQ